MNCIIGATVRHLDEQTDLRRLRLADEMPLEVQRSRLVDDLMLLDGPYTEAGVIKLLHARADRNKFQVFKEYFRNEDFVIVLSSHFPCLFYQK